MLNPLEGSCHLQLFETEFNIINNNKNWKPKCHTPLTLEGSCHLQLQQSRPEHQHNKLDAPSAAGDGDDDHDHDHDGADDDD